MHQPLFIETSRGYVNLALVRYICPPEIRNGFDCIRFMFCDGENEADWIAVPTDEGKMIIRALMSERPELFLAA